ncbi:Transcription factor bHLH35-like protein [Melia azedarach]|uniref:Transcription factor bHLH35-like protein n=1 Tax=Melia azedarach TaxID=155640 RepID=A0ACC1WY69_MELAZ|nr:Transcription factor bHLH35-like protein [Melia azedarach]
MVSSLQRRRALRRKLHILRTLTNSKSMKKSSIIVDCLLYIYKLKLKLEAIRREYSNLMAIKNAYLELMKSFQVPKEVKVEKIGERFTIRVKCNKGGNRLVSILEAFEKMGLLVLQASVSCNYNFSMEATAVAQNQQALDATDVTQLLLKAIEKQAAVDWELSKA